MPDDLSTSKKDRYPGLSSFDVKDHAIFFGRDKEKKELLQLIKKEDFVIFYSRSGLGKSSLINAGMTALLESNSFRPMRIRFQVKNPQEKEPVITETPLFLVHQQIEV